MLRNILIFVLFSLLFFFLIYFTPAPKSWIDSSTTQIFIFFILLLSVATTLPNIFLNYLPRSFVLGLGFLMLSVQQTLGSLSYLTGGLTILATILLFWFIPQKRLTRSPKIPKITHVFKDSDNQKSQRRLRRLRRARLS